MTPKQKAKELFEKYSKGKDEHGWFLCEFESCAKQCALIAVDELIKEIRSYDVFLHHESAKDFMKLNSTIETNVLNYLNYWNEVKQEIEKL